MTSHIYHRIHSFCILLIAALLTVSCTQEEDANGTVGYLHFPSFEVDMTVEDLVETRSVTLPNVPDNAAQVTFVVKDKDGVEVYNKQGAWTAPLVLPVGTYTIDATYGSNTFNRPYFQGTASGTIVALSQEKPSLQMSLKNALVNVSVATALAEHFTPTTLTLTANGQSIVANCDTWYYIPAGYDVAVNMNGTNSVDAAASFLYTLNSPEAGKAYNVVCDKEGTNWPTITLPEQQEGAWNTRLYIKPASVGGNISDENKSKLVYEVSLSSTDWSNAVTAEQISGDYYVVKGLVNGTIYYVRARIGNVTSEVRSITMNENLPGTAVTAEHYPDGSHNLAGTNATLAFELTSTLKEWKDKGLLEVQEFELLRGSTLVRTATVAGLMDPVGAWPYLPKQGSSYVLNVKHKLTIVDETVLTSSSSCSVPSPSFTLSLTSYSSYDKYKAGERDFANDMNAFDIEKPGATWTISADLIDNSNYTKSFSYVFNNASSTPAISGEGYSIANKTGLALGSYPVSASLTFDGVTASATATHHITGIPYKQGPLVESAWTAETNRDSRITWSSGGVNLRPNYAWSSAYAKITSNQTFRLPAQVNVNVINDGKKNGRLGVKYYLRFGSTALIDGSTYGNNSSINYNASTGFGAGDYKVQIETSYNAANSTSSFDVTKVNVLYGPLP